MSQEPLYHLLKTWFTVALRTWMLKHIVPTLSLVGLRQSLSELELAGEENLTQQNCEAYLQSLFAELLQSQEMESAAAFISLCESLMQFYIVEQQDDSFLIELNQKLPPGVSFSLVTGAFLFEAELYFHAHNLYVSEQPLRMQAQWEQKQAQAPPVQNEAHGKMAIPEELSPPPPPAAEPAEANMPFAVPRTDSRQAWFRQIRRRRMLLLKEWENDHDEN